MGEEDGTADPPKAKGVKKTKTAEAFT